MKAELPNLRRIMKFEFYEFLAKQKKFINYIKIEFLEFPANHEIHEPGISGES